MENTAIKVIDVEFSFKGERSYIQGPDLYNSLVNVGFPVEEIKNIHFTAHDFVRTPNCLLYLADAKNDLVNLSGVCVRCNYDVGGVTKWLAITQGSDGLETANRVDYDEGKIIRHCHVVEDGIELLEPSPYTFIETVVSMNKHMHQNLFPEANGKWIFTRIDLDEFVDANEGLSLQLKHNLNYRLTRSDIRIDGSKVGDLYFSLVK